MRVHFHCRLSCEVTPRMVCSRDARALAARRASSIEISDEGRPRRARASFITCSVPRLGPVRLSVSLPGVLDRRRWVLVDDGEEGLAGARGVFRGAARRKRYGRRACERPEAPCAFSFSFRGVFLEHRSGNPPPVPRPLPPAPFFSPLLRFARPPRGQRKTPFAPRKIGSGFAGTLMSGTTHNDEFYVDQDGRTRTRTNRSGGVQGGISNGENIVVRVVSCSEGVDPGHVGVVCRGVGAARRAWRARTSRHPAFHPGQGPCILGGASLSCCASVSWWCRTSASGRG